VFFALNLSSEMELVQNSAESAETKMELLEENHCCAICFEEVGWTPALPCACNVLYCALCWDRSLAHSFNASGQARCPTCRGAVHVDFDPERLCLVFSRAAVPSTPELEGLGFHDARQVKEASKNEAVQKLRQQALPAQVRLLQAHGGLHPGLNDIARQPADQMRRMSVLDLERHIASIGGSSDECLGKEDLVCRCLQEATEKQMIGRVLGEMFTAVTERLPACCCGSSLVRVSGEERTMRCCDKMPMLSGLPRDSHHYQVIFTRLTSVQTSICFCDLCGTSVPTANAVWTCKNGDTTILHATSYDVCDECFMRHAACGESLDISEEPSAMDVDMSSGSQSAPPPDDQEDL